MKVEFGAMGRHSCLACQVQATTWDACLALHVVLVGMIMVASAAALAVDVAALAAAAVAVVDVEAAHAPCQA